MPAYLIQQVVRAAPKGSVKRISNALDLLGVSDRDGWRYVLLPEASWKGVIQSFGKALHPDSWESVQVLPHETKTAFSYLSGKVTYINEDQLPRTSDDDVLGMLAHELGHRKFGPREDVANLYARTFVKEANRLRKLGIKIGGRFEPTSVNLGTQLNNQVSLKDLRSPKLRMFISRRRT